MVLRGARIGGEAGRGTLRDVDGDERGVASVSGTAGNEGAATDECGSELRLSLEPELDQRALVVRPRCASNVPAPIDGLPRRSLDAARPSNELLDEPREMDRPRPGSTSGEVGPAWSVADDEDGDGLTVANAPAPPADGGEADGEGVDGPEDEVGLGDESTGMGRRPLRMLLLGCADDGGPSVPGARADERGPTAAAVTAGGGSLRGGAAVLRGSGLQTATSARFGDAEAVPVRARATAAALTVPAAVDYVAGPVPVRLLDATGAVVAATTWRYRPVDGVDRQLAYVLRYWQDYNPAYQRLGDTDCVDFASQSLLERGWREQGAWTHAEQVHLSGAAWVSSTAFRDFMAARPELGTALTDDQRDRVRLGDVVQFDWDGTGDRDHTGVVTRITRTADGIRIGFAGHTKDSDYRDVDDSITVDHPGGRAFYWSLA